MHTLLYRFDRSELFPLLGEQTSARGGVEIRAGRRAGEPVLRVSLQRHVDDTADVKVKLALPLVAVEGNPRQFLLDLVGDASGCELFLEAADRLGWGFSYSLGAVDFPAAGTLSVDVQRPREYWDARKENGTTGVVPPVQLFRLVIAMAAKCTGFDLALCALRASGEVRLAPSGIASAPGPRA